MVQAKTEMVMRLDRWQVQTSAIKSSSKPLVFREGGPSMLNLAKLSESYLNSINEFQQRIFGLPCKWVAEAIDTTTPKRDKLESENSAEFDACA